MPDSVRYDIEHVSHYVYSPPVRHSVMSLCMRPRDDSGQRLLSFDVRTRPLSSLNAETDGFGNTKHVLNIHREHTTLEIIAHSTVETTHSPPLPDSLGPGCVGRGPLVDGGVHQLGVHPSQRLRPANASPSRLH